MANSKKTKKTKVVTIETLVADQIKASQQDLAGWAYDVAAEVRDSEALFNLVLNTARAQLRKGA